MTSQTKVLTHFLYNYRAPYNIDQTRKIKQDQIHTAEDVEFSEPS
jgi:hypothetical protein